MKEKNENELDGSVYTSYNGLRIPQETLDEIMEASNRLMINERNKKIDKLINEE